jgi:transcriptional regulator with XRE-family HTH domain
MTSKRIDFGQYLLELRTKAGYSQKKVADKLGIDISLLSKIEHGERFIQSHMLKGISELFNLSLKNLHIAFLKQKIDSELSSFPYAHEAIEEWLRSSKNKKSPNEKA